MQLKRHFDMFWGVIPGEAGEASRGRGIHLTLCSGAIFWIPFPEDLMVFGRE
jgi:hypothetical protein